MFTALQHMATDEILLFDRPPYARSASNPVEEELLARGIRYRCIYITVTATDPAENASQPSARRRFNVDAARPEVAITTPDSSIFFPGVATIRGTAGDNRGVVRVGLEYYDAMGALIARNARCACGPASTPIVWDDDAPSTPGIYRVVATAYDEAGNRSTSAQIMFFRF